MSATAKITPPPSCTKHDRAYASSKRQVIKPKEGSPLVGPTETTGWICRVCGARGRATGKHRGNIDYAKTVVQFHWPR